MYAPTLYFGEKVRKYWKKYNNNAFDGRPQQAILDINKFESYLVKNSINNGVDIGKVMKKIKTIKAILREDLSEEGKKHKLIRHTRELVEIMNERLIKGNVLNILDMHMKEFSNLFIDFLNEGSTKRSERIHDLLEILDRVKKLDNQIEDEQLSEEYNKFCKIIAHLEGDISGAITDENKKRRDAIESYKKVMEKSNQIINYKPERGFIEEKPEKESEEEKEKEVVGQLDGKNLSEEELRKIRGDLE